MISLIITVVISNPYQGIDYNSINSYEINNQEYLEDVIHVTEAEASSDIEVNDEESCDVNEKEKQYQQELNKLYPYIFPSYK